MTYYLAPSLARLRAQINAMWPGRDKTSDGWIGDPSHQARKSDHNPDYSSGGVVRALDIDVDGIDVGRVLEAVIYDPRVSYVIYNRRIWGGSFWRDYDGSNPHTKHIHVSIKHTRAAESGHDWNFPDYAAAPTTVTPSEELTVSQYNELKKDIAGLEAQIKSLQESQQSEHVSDYGNGDKTNVNGALTRLLTLVRRVDEKLDKAD